MSNPFGIHRKSIAIVSLFFVFALSTAWATEQYSGSVVIGMGDEGEIQLIDDSDGEVEIDIEEGSIDAYLQEQGIDEVEITVEMFVDIVEYNGNTYHHFTFVFSPSGCYFDANDPLEIEIEGEYVNVGGSCQLYDEDGEEVEYEFDESDLEIEYFIEHFSSYSYDHYDD